jgi:hypothetical protein
MITFVFQFAEISAKKAKKLKFPFKKLIRTFLLFFKINYPLLNDVNALLCRSSVARFMAFFSMFLRLCALTACVHDPQFHALSCTTSTCRVQSSSIMGRSSNPLPALCAFPPWMVGTSLSSHFVLRIWTDATSSLGTIGSFQSVQHMSPLSFCGLLKRRSIGFLLTIVGCPIRKVSVFRIGESG